MSTRPFKSNVERGIVWLNEHFPGWENQLKPYNLRMGSCTACVFGQLTGHYHHIVYSGMRPIPRKYKADELLWEEAVKLGFDMDLIKEEDDCSGLTYDDLTEEWVTQLEERMKHG